MKKVFMLLCCLLLSVAQQRASDRSGDDRIEACNIAICQVESSQLYAQHSAYAQVTGFATGLLDTSDWPARWNCGNWTFFHGWLYIISDIIIWLSYFMIPLALGYFVYKRKQDPIPFRSIVYLFIAFILACGLTHLIDAAIFWWPAYRLSAAVRFVTAVVSMATVVALVKIAPKVVVLKSPETLEEMVEIRTRELQAVNNRLQEEVSQREKVERQLLIVNKELEQQAKDLEEMNRILILREHDLMKSEEQIRHLNTKLEKLVEERTRELKASNEQLEAFTYSVSHDLRAPLRAIDGYARILEEDYNERIDAQGRHLIKVITKNAKYMGQLIDDLLEFSRTSRAELRKNTFQTAEEVKRIISDLIVHEKNRSIEIDVKPLETSKGDVTMLRQVWVNLISNALKYTRKTENAHIEIGCTKHDHEIEFYVRDNGVGFEMAYVDKLFGVFQRLHKKEEFEGTGVGLALVHRIIERHGGKIWASAKLNEGATFCFSLPL